MAVMLSSAQAYTWGTSGLVWFIVPNGLAVIIMVPCLTIQYEILSGTARNQTLTPPMIISNNPPDANAFSPVSIRFKRSNIFHFLTGARRN